MPYRPLRLPPGVDLRGELERLAQADPEFCGFIVSGIGSLERPVLRFADQARGVVLAGPQEVITLAGSVSRDGAHLHLVVADAEGHTLGGTSATEAGCGRQWKSCCSARKAGSWAGSGMPPPATWS